MCHGMFLPLEIRPVRQTERFRFAPGGCAAHSVAYGLLMTGDTVDGCPAAVKASSTAEDTGMCNASVARFAPSTKILPRFASS
jgi:hypothetical protein